MKEQKNIDRLFQEKFKDFEVNPPEFAWYHVENTLQKKTKTKAKPIWMWFTSGIAVGMALLYLLNTPFHVFAPQTPNATPAHRQEIVTQQSVINSEITLENRVETTPQSVELSPEPQPFVRKKQSVPVFKTLLRQEPILVFIAPQRPLTETVSLPPLSHQEQGNNIVPMVSEKNSLTDLPSTELAMQKPMPNSNKKWMVSTVAAPVVLNSFDKQVSALDHKMDENEKNAKFSSAYGVQVAYKMNRKLTIQTGLHVVDYAYLTQDIDLSTGGRIVKYNNIEYADDVAIVSPQYNSATPATTYSETSLKSSKGDLTQIYGYYEIPIEAKYQIVGGNHFGLQAIGGFSTLVLNKNEIYIETSNYTNKLGEATNLNTLNFSGNVGLELDYKLLKNVNINVVPMFKVQTRTLNTENTFKPYTLGLYSGLNFRF